MTGRANLEIGSGAAAWCLAWALAAAPGCQAIASFDTSNIEEDDSALCSDETDNDDDGLTDCQDFNCLGTEVCCTIPTVEIEDDFECPGGEASCEAPCAPDGERWQAWGTPFPVVCEGALIPDKREQCYDVGVLSRQEVVVQPGLSVEATLAGMPEQRGRLEVGVTLQDQIAGGNDPCTARDTARPVISAAMLAAESGYRLVARFDDADVGVSELFEDAGPRRLSIMVADDRRVTYLVDGEPFARSPADSTIPESGLEGRVVLSGRGSAARFEGVTVTVGTQCEDPHGWRREDDLAGLAPSAAGWDNHAVQAPAIAALGSEQFELYYTGCSEKLGKCDPLIAGLGRAEAGEELAFARSGGECPLLGAPTLICSDGMENPFADRFNNLIDAESVELAGRRLLLISQFQAGREIRVVETGEGAPPLDSLLEGGISSGSAGAWDAHEICCPAALAEGGRLYVWYAGRAGPEAPWNVGLATSDDGRSFEKHPDNPVLESGAAGAFDERGVMAPAVVFERGLYRMWYEAAGFFGATSIGYAVSVDGVVWHKLPANPILEPKDLDLRAVGAPSVVVDGDRLVMAIEGESQEGIRRIYGLVNRGGSP